MDDIKNFFIYKKAIFAKRIISYFKEGSSLPVVAEDTNNKKYFVKLSGTGEGINVLAAEYIAVKIAALIGIPVQEPVFISVNQQTIVDLQRRNQEVEELVKASCGLNLGFDLIERPRPFNEAYDGKYLSAEYRQLIYLFDCFLLNADRTVNNPNIVFKNNIPFVTDYGASFLFKGIFSNKDFSESEVIISNLKKHIFHFHKDKSDPYILLNRLKKIPDKKLTSIVNEVPPQWADKNTKDMIMNSLSFKTKDHNYLERILELISIAEVESDEEIRKRQKQKLIDFKNKFGIK